MQYEEFEKNFISISKSLTNDKEYNNFIEENAKKAITNYLKNKEKPIHIKGLVSKLNDLIITDLIKFKYIEKILRHELFTEVLKEFRQSDVLIRAIKNNKRDAVKWLMTMDINYFVQDENGVTALMEAAANPNYLFVVKEILKKNENVVNITDNNGSNVLFYVTDRKIFYFLYRTKVDFNQINKEGDTVLIRCCRRRFCPNFQRILNRTDDINHVNNRGKTAAMYLVENGRARELRSLCRFINVNLNYKNENNECALSILIDQFKDIYANDRFICMEDYVYTMIILIINYCDFNVPIDKEGNTAIMFFIMVGDYFASTLLLEKCKNLDLSIKNKHGISASYLLFWIYPKEKNFRQKLFSHDTFDIDYVDNDNNNLIMHFLARGQLNEEYSIALQRRKAKNHVNNKKENEIIIATKLGLLTDEQLFDGNDVNQQDFKGNTALHYAVKLKDKYAINMLAYQKADPTIKNEQGVSAFDMANKMANETEDNSIIEILKNPIIPVNMAKELMKRNKKKQLNNKIDNNVKPCQNDIYQQEYDYLIKNKVRSYSLTNISEFALDTLLDIYLGLYKTEAPNIMLSERRSIKKKKRIKIAMMILITTFECL